ncbi:hypothetical protein HOY82DRAFT_603218 [Tuber indicum]|nr:hypothetical protein HOY82DRAFT_603218 [Tuber indicum]
MFTPTITFPSTSPLTFAAPILTHPIEAITSGTTRPQNSSQTNISFTDEDRLLKVTAHTSYICDTTSGPPSVHRIRVVSGELREKFAEQCDSRTRYARSRRTQLGSLGDAAISPCGVLFTAGASAALPGSRGPGSRPIALGKV